MPKYESYRDHERGMRHTVDVTEHVRVVPQYEELTRKVVVCTCGKTFSGQSAYGNHVKKYHNGVADAPYEGPKVFSKRKI